jgi:tyrosinase
MWDPVTGFGGNGDPNQERKIGPYTFPCIADGPFKDLRPSYMEAEYVPHCLTRDFNNGTDHPGNMYGPDYTPEVVARINSYNNFTAFARNLEEGPHGAIHAMIGGDMDPVTSPNGQSHLATLLHRFIADMM